MAKMAERVYWNARAYGNAFRIKKNWIRGIFVSLCLATPGTNWMIPFILRIVRHDYMLRF